jgi:hypothetical protein
MNKNIKLDANILLKPFLKCCLRVSMTMLSINVLRTEEEESLNEIVLNDLYVSALDVSVMFKALLGLEKVNSKVLIKTLKKVEEFSRDISKVTDELLEEYNVAKDVQFEFYKIALNAERLCEVIEDCFDRENKTITLSENSIFLRSLEIMEHTKLGDYFIDMDLMTYDEEAEKVNIKFVLGDDMFDALFKVIMSGVVKDILTANLSHIPDISLVESTKHLCTLYNMRLIYKEDDPSEILDMLKFSESIMFTLFEIIDDSDEYISILDEAERGRFEKCNELVKLLIKALKKKSFKIENGYINIDSSIKKILKEQFR